MAESVESCLAQSPADLGSVGFLLPAASLAWREVVRFARQPARIAGALATPMLFWFLLGSGLGRSFTVGGAAAGGYLEYFFTGTLVMIVLFTSIFATISVIEDRHEGFLQGVLVSPASRLSIVAGKILGSSILATAQSGLFLLLAPLTGVPLTWAGGIACTGVLLLLAVGLGGMGLAVAWRMDSVQGFHSIMNLVMMPMWILSGAVFPASGASKWIHVVMVINPLTYGVGLVRATLHGPSTAAGTGSPPPSVCWIVSTAFALAMILLSARLAGRDRLETRA